MYPSSKANFKICSGILEKFKDNNLCGIHFERSLTEGRVPQFVVVVVFFLKAHLRSCSRIECFRDLTINQNQNPEGNVQINILVS